MPMRSLAACCLAFALVWLAALGTGLAVDNEPPNAAVDLTSVRQKIKAKDWQGAIAELKPIVARIDNADAYNLYAFSLRNVGDRKAAFTYYAKALDFDPKHKSAREYLGELYVITGDMAKAREQLAILEKLCPSGCEELEDLRKAIAGAAQGPIDGRSAAGKSAPAALPPPHRNAFSSQQRTCSRCRPWRWCRRSGR